MVASRTYSSSNTIFRRDQSRNVLQMPRARSAASHLEVFLRRPVLLRRKCFGDSGYTAAEDRLKTLTRRLRTDRVVVLWISFGAWLFASIVFVSGAEANVTPTSTRSCNAVASPSRFWFCARSFRSTDPAKFFIGTEWV